MKGLELAQAYYDAHGKQMIHSCFPKYEQRIAVGLVGQGSECFGFDDALSVDHDFGPSFCLWLTREDHRAIGHELQTEYYALPQNFMGFPARVERAESGDRVGVQMIDSFYRNQIGRSDAHLSLLEWLHIPESRLATVTNGKVFYDPLGSFSQIRNVLLRFYPEDVRLKKIAARAAVMAQSGQYNYARCMRRGETVAALLALNEFIKHTMSMIFLLNRTYTPFYKWMHRAMLDLPLLGEVSGLIRELSVTGIHAGLWQDAAAEETPHALNRCDRNIAIIEEICHLVKKQLQDENLTDSDDDFLAALSGDIMAHIQDPAIKSMHVMEG